MAVALDQPFANTETTADHRRPGLPFSFSGKAGEYFGIWIVNLLLSVITLGIYSAWAKVRTKRYFYGNTKLDGNAFDYLASPLQILKGRLIMFAFFAAYALCSSFAPALVWVFIIAMIIVTPWAVIRARAFNAYYSSYRNVRFGFTGRLWEAVQLYILLPIASFLTLGGLLPYTAYRTNRFMVNKSLYGQTAMTFSGKAGAYYRIYALAFLQALPAVVLFGGFMAFSVYVGVQSALGGEEEAQQAASQLLTDVMVFLGPYVAWLPYIIIGSAILWIIGSAYLTTRLQSYLFNNTRIGPHELTLDLKLSRILWLRFSNLVMIALTIGLMIPWAKIRMARYQIERMSLVPHGDLDVSVSEQQSKVGAYGDELGEGMDLDLGLGV